MTSEKEPAVRQVHDDENAACWCHPKVICAWCDAEGGHCGHPEPFIVVHQKGAEV